MSKEVLISSNGIKQAIDDLVNENEDLKERIDKAIKRINKGIFIIPKDTDEVLKILKGESNE